MNIQWYPGHMTKAIRQMREDIKLIDVVIELIDARVPFSSKNPDIDELAKNKYRLIVFNKIDLADEAVTAKWEAYYKEKGFATAKINARDGQGIKSINNVVKEACKEKIERDRKRGILNRPLRAMIVGIPNVGKSTFINSYTRKAVTKVGNKPGVTKGKQWIRLSKDIELLDTPGILWPKFDDKKIGLDLAYIGSINDNILSITDVAYELINFLDANYCNSLAERYNVDNCANAAETLAFIAEKRACIRKGGEVDIDKAAALLMDDFRSGKLGRISVEVPEDFER